MFLTLCQNYAIICHIFWKRNILQNHFCLFIRGPGRVFFFFLKQGRKSLDSVTLTYNSTGTVRAYVPCSTLPKGIKCGRLCPTHFFVWRKRGKRGRKDASFPPSQNVGGYALHICLCEGKEVEEEKDASFPPSQNVWAGMPYTFVCVKEKGEKRKRMLLSPSQKKCFE